MYKTTFQNGEIYLVIPKEELLQNQDRIRNMILNDPSGKIPCLRVVSSNNSVNAPANYIYSKEQLSILNDINNFYIRHNIKNGIKFSENYILDKYEDFHNAWDFDLVLKANRSIDGLVKTIRDFNLSPFETVVFIHDYLTNFEYKDLEPTSKWNNESPRTILGIFSDERAIVCCGYANFFKAIIDKLNSPDLKCGYISCGFINRNKLNMSFHEQNWIYMNDRRYGKNGYYCVDATPREKGKVDIPDFSTCLFPLKNLRNYKNVIYTILRPKIKQEFLSSEKMDKLYSKYAKIMYYTRYSNKNLVVKTLETYFDSKEIDRTKDCSPIFAEDFGNAIFTIYLNYYAQSKGLSRKEFERSADFDIVQNDIYNFYYKIKKKSITLANLIFDDNATTPFSKQSISTTPDYNV